MTPPPGGNIAGGSTTFTWNAGLGATQYTITATTANGQTSSATTGAEQLTATLSLPASSQTETVTLQTMTASGALTQAYTYTIQPSGTAQPLTLMPGNPIANVIANGQEVRYTYAYNSNGGARPSPQDIAACQSSNADAIKIRIVQLTANTATLGFTASAGTAPMAFDWECDDGDGWGSGGSGSGGTSTPSPIIDSISPPSLIAGVPTTITITGENLGTSGLVVPGGPGGCSLGDATWSFDDTQITVNNVVALNPGPSYCTVSVESTSGESTLDSPDYPIAVISNDPAAPLPPVIKKITPAFGPVGGSVEVFLDGSGFGTSPTVTVKDAKGGNIPASVKSSQYSGDTLVDMILAIPENAAGGNATVTIVATAGGPSSNGVSFYVQIPTSLVRRTVGCPPDGPCTAPAGAPNGVGAVYTPGTPPPNGPILNALGKVVSDQATNVCGVYQNLGYSIVDQQTPTAQVIQGLKNITLTETFSNFTGSGTVRPTQTQAVDLVNCAGIQGCLADVLDTMSLFGSTCLPANYNNQFTQAFSVTIGKTTYKLSSTNAVSIGNFSDTLKVTVTFHQ